MSGYHGTVGAIGVRLAVCPEPIRRALTLAGLVTGVLFTVWLVSAAPAHSSELPGAENPLTAGVVGGTGLVTGTETLGGSLSGAVTTVGERATQHATQAVDGASETARAVEAEASEPVQQVRDAVRETSLPRPDHLTDLVAPETGRVTEPVRVPEDEDPSADDRQDDRETGVQAPDERRAVAERPAADALVAAQERGSVEHRAGDAAERDRSTDTAPRSAEALTTIAGGTAPASGGTAFAPAVAGFLPVTGAPAPAPGLFEAARHVLRSVPAESADEPTFSPD